MSGGEKEGSANRMPGGPGRKRINFLHMKNVASKKGEHLPPR